jgi:hypothetical protein
VQNYGWNAVVGSMASLLSIWVVRRLVVRDPSNPGQTTAKP